MYRNIIQLSWLVLVITACYKPKNLNFPTAESQYLPPKRVKANPAIHPIPQNIAQNPLKKTRSKPLGKPRYTDTRLNSYPIPIDVTKLTYMWDEHTKELVKRNIKPISPISVRLEKPRVVPAKGKTMMAGLPITLPYVPPIMKDNDTYGILSLGQDQGLPSNIVECVAKDELGRTWVGTDNGLALLEGDQIKVYTVEQGLSSNQISCLLIEPGKLWIGTYTGGLNLFENGRFTHFKRENGFPQNDVNALAKVNGKLWIGTSGGLCYLQRNQFAIYQNSQVLSSDHIIKLWAEQERLWIGTYESGLYQLENDQITHYTIQNGLSDNGIRSLFKEKDRLWIGTEQGGLNVLENGQFTQYTMAQGLKSNKVRSILKDGDRLWIGTSKGVNLMKNGQLTFYDTEHGLSSNEVISFLQEDDQLLIATQAGGLHFLKQDQLTHYGIQNGLLDSYISCLWTEQNKEKICLGSFKGLSCLENGRFVHYDTKSGLSSNYIWNIAGASDKLWIATSAGLDLLQNNQVTHYTNKDGLVTSSVWSLLEDGEKLWIGYNGGGMSVLENGRLTHYNTETGLSNDYVSCFAKEGNRVWIGTNGGGVNLLENGQFKHYTKATGLSNDQITSLLFENGRVWIGTNGGGVNIIERNQIWHYNRQQGLVDNGVTQLALDSLGQVWVGTSRGLTRFVRKPDGGYQLRNWTKAHGFKFVNFNGYGNPMRVDASNTLWASIGDGLTAFRLPPKDTLPPKLFLTGLDINQKKINWSRWTTSDKKIVDTSWFNQAGISWSGLENQLPYWLPKKLVVPYHQNHFTLHYSGLKQTEQGEVVYRYMLVGLDTKWSTFTHEGKAEYKNIPPGRYTFKVRAKGQNNVWSNEVSLSFEITPPWWKTWWAYGLYGVFTVLLVYGFTSWRTQTLKKRQKVLEQIVAQRTSELQEANEELRTQKEEIFSRNEELHQSQEELETQRDYIAQRNQELLKKNTQINQSIKAAKSIQQALLPAEQLFAECFSDYFIFFRPRDIVSGDFYWLNKTQEAVWLAVADCTGHGVPGAFMTMLGKSLLERLINVRKLATPAEVLQKLDEAIILTLRQKETKNRAGMDIILLKVTKGDTAEVQYAGAKSALYVTNAQKEVAVYKGCRVSIGGVKQRAERFVNRTVATAPGTELFLSTDGYEDQNDVRRKSFNRTRLMNLFQKLSTLDTADQKQALLDETLRTHMQDTEQRDDILVVGIKIGEGLGKNSSNKKPDL